MNRRTVDMSCFVRAVSCERLRSWSVSAAQPTPGDFFNENKITSPTGVLRSTGHHFDYAGSGKQPNRVSRRSEDTPDAGHPLGARFPTKPACRRRGERSQAGPSPQQSEYDLPRWRDHADAEHEGDLLGYELGNLQRRQDHRNGFLVHGIQQLQLREDEYGVHRLKWHSGSDVAVRRTCHRYFCFDRRRKYLNDPGGGVQGNYKSGSYWQRILRGVQ